jgi:hypothetical protein
MMDHPELPGLVPGASILGGAAAGLTYDGALRDAVAREDIARRRERGRLRPVAPPQTQGAAKPDSAQPPAVRHAET